MEVLSGAFSKMSAFMSKKKQTGQEEISERVWEIGRVSLPNCATSLTHHQAAQLVFNEALQIVTRENELTQSDRTVEKSVGLFEIITYFLRNFFSISGFNIGYYRGGRL